MTKKLKIAVIYGSYRSDRLGIRAANFCIDQLNEKCETIFLDAKEIDLPILDRMYKEYADGEAPENLQKASEALQSSDGYVIITGEYNHGFQPGLKNFLDHFQKEYFFKPSGVVSYSRGSFGGVRVAMHARAVLAELGMSSIPSIQPIPKIDSALDENGIAEDSKMIKRFDRFSTELLWYADAMKVARENGTPY
ncbi:NAD(P)H-dependent oxidoreductase [Cryomorphaceae bacterium 1068]|nr:NAD(P)H-dependent oxidoreductase [Cryomorphaceae bacterium 1068]